MTAEIGDNNPPAREPFAMARHHLLAEATISLDGRPTATHGHADAFGGIPSGTQPTPRVPAKTSQISEAADTTPDHDGQPQF